MNDSCHSTQSTGSHVLSMIKAINQSSPKKVSSEVIHCRNSIVQIALSAQQKRRATASAKKFVSNLPFEESDDEEEKCIPQPGDSLKVDPLGSFHLPSSFEDVYVLGDIINEGAFGVVYKAHHVSYDEHALVAVKVIERLGEDDFASESGCMDDEDVLLETSILRDVRDVKNVVSLFDFYMDSNKFYVIQELAAGGDVFDRLLERTTYTESDVRDLAKILLTTVHSLHDRKILHRDLKPENLLLKTTQSDADIILCDFGYAKYLPSDGKGLWTHCGTPSYTAPEIIDAVEYWAEVDMWSVGCILFILLGGYQAFDGDNDRETYDLISRADYGFDEPIWESISSQAKSLIENLLTLDRKHRYTAQQALQCDWFVSVSTEKLEHADLTETQGRIRKYCEFTRPEGLHFMDENYVADWDELYRHPSSTQSQKALKEKKEEDKKKKKQKDEENNKEQEEEEPNRKPSLRPDGSHFSQVYVDDDHKDGGVEKSDKKKTKSIYLRPEGSHFVRG